MQFDCQIPAQLPDFHIFKAKMRSGHLFPGSARRFPLAALPFWAMLPPFRCIAMARKCLSTTAFELRRFIFSLTGTAGRLPLQQLLDQWIIQEPRDAAMQLLGMANSFGNSLDFSFLAIDVLIEHFGK